MFVEPIQIVSLSVVSFLSRNFAVPAVGENMDLSVRMSEKMRLIASHMVCT